MDWLERQGGHVGGSKAGAADGWRRDSSHLHLGDGVQEVILGAAPRIVAVLQVLQAAEALRGEDGISLFPARSRLTVIIVLICGIESVSESHKAS